MSSNRKWLKICSFAQFILAIAAFIIAFIAAQGASELGSDISLGELVLFWLDKILYAVLGFLSLADSVMGIHGANRPSALGSHRLLCILGVVFGIVAMIVSGAGAGVPVVPCITVVVDAAAAVFDTKVRKELDERR